MSGPTKITWDKIPSLPKTHGTQKSLTDSMDIKHAHTRAHTQNKKTNMNEG